MVLAHQHPERVDRLVLVDGGLPLDVPAGLTADEVVRLVLGPAAERLAMRFASVEDYLDFWRAHPAFADTWSDTVENYLAYDLVGEEPQLRPATRYEVMATDTEDLNTGSALVRALEELRHPATLLTAPRGLQDQVPGLYTEDRLASMLPHTPSVRAAQVPDVNHYTIVMSPEGAAAVAECVLAELGQQRVVD